MKIRKLLTNAMVLAEKNSGIIVHGTAIFFLLAGFFYSLYLGNSFRFPDEEYYYIFATNLAEGRGFTFDGVNPCAWRTPGYPLFLMPFLKLGASVVFLRYLNFIALASLPYIIRAILRHVNAEPGSSVSSILLVGYGVLFYTAGTLYPQTMVTLVMLIMFWLTTGAHFSYRHALIFGLLSASLIMLHPTTIFIPPLILIWMFTRYTWPLLRKAALTIVVIIICFSPWIYRNYKAFGDFIPLSTQAGLNLYTSYDKIVTDVETDTDSMDEINRDRFYIRKTISIWKEHPIQSMKQYALKVLNHFNFQNKFYVKSEFNKLRSIIMFVTYYPLLLCLISRLLFIRKIPLRNIEVLFILTYFVSALFHAIFHTRIRYRLPYDVLLITHIGIMFSYIMNYIRSGREQVTTHNNV